MCAHVQVSICEHTRSIIRIKKTFFASFLSNVAPYALSFAKVFISFSSVVTAVQEISKATREYLLSVRTLFCYETIIILLLIETSAIVDYIQTLLGAAELTEKYYPKTNGTHYCLANG